MEIDPDRANWDAVAWENWFAELVQVSRPTSLDVGGVYVALGAGAAQVMAALRSGTSPIYADILDMLRSPSGIDLSQPVAETLLNSLVSASVLSAEQADKLLATAKRWQSRRAGVLARHVRRCMETE